MCVGCNLTFNRADGAQADSGNEMNRNLCLRAALGQVLFVLAAEGRLSLPD